MLKKVIRITIALCILLLVLVYWIIEFVLPYSPIIPYRYDVAKASEFVNGFLPSDYGLKFDHLDILTMDSIHLKGYYIASDSDKATIIVLHGIADCKEHSYSFCKFLNSLGCNVVIMDSRAHGQSGGEFCTFGAKEKYDIQRVIDFISIQYKDTTIGIFGASLGGAIALQAISLDSRIKFGIIESTFNNLEAVTNEYLQDIIGIKIPSLVKRTLRKSGEIAGFDPFSVHPSESAKAIQCPMFFAHGSKDFKIPIEFNKANYNNIASIEKEFHTIEGAHHTDLHEVGATNYKLLLSVFIKKHIHNK